MHACVGMQAPKKEKKKKRNKVGICENSKVVARRSNTTTVRSENDSLLFKKTTKGRSGPAHSWRFEGLPLRC